MKLTIISVIMSFLSMARCDSCGPSYFSTRHECKKCFCSGVSDQCHAGSFYPGEIKGNLDSLKGIMEISEEGKPSSNVTLHFGAVHRFPKGLRNFTFRWILLSEFYGNRARSYGGYLRIIQKIEAPPFGMVDQIILVSLRSGEDKLTTLAQPYSSSDYRFVYEIPLEEDPWKVATRGNVPATRSDMMMVLLYLDYIEVYAPYVSDMETVSIEEFSMDTAEDSPTKPFSSLHKGLIEICECPEGYSGDSCETCSCGYYRDSDYSMQGAFGKCQHCPCDRDDQPCQEEKCMGMSAFSGCDQLVVNKY